MKIQTTKQLLFLFIDFLQESLTKLCNLSDYLLIFQKNLITYAYTSLNYFDFNSVAI